MMTAKTVLLLSLTVVGLSLYIHEYHSATFIHLVSRVSVLKTVTDEIHKWFHMVSDPQTENAGITSSTRKLSNKSVPKADKSGTLKLPTTPSVGRIFTVDELNKHDGKEDSTELYLAILGKVYDVKKGEKHYGPGGGYHFFAGRDGTRAFVTGDFTESGLTDDITGLSSSDLRGVKDWSQFYEKEYKYVGKVIGRYYDSKGEPTDYWHNAQYQMQSAKREKSDEEEEKKIFPPCNVEWTPEKGSRVWCSRKSGGIERDWVGVPRKFYQPGSKAHRCACIKTSGDADSNVQNSERNELKNPRLEEYANCKPDSETCWVKS